MSTHITDQTARNCHERAPRRADPNFLIRPWLYLKPGCVKDVKALTVQWKRKSLRNSAGDCLRRRPREIILV